MSRYDWLRQEIDRVPRKKFHVFEQPSMVELEQFEARYGPLPNDYREFVSEFGEAMLFRSSHSQWYHLIIRRLPRIHRTDDLQAVQEPIRLELGHFIESGKAWLEWKDGAVRRNGAVFSGLFGQRPKTFKSFEAWLRSCVTLCKSFYSKAEWGDLIKPVMPFSDYEQAIVDALPKFDVRKLGVGPDGNVMIEIHNGSSLELSFLTVGVRSLTGMEGAVSLPTTGIKPGMTRITEEDLYKGSMDPNSVELFRLPQPDPEDRNYYLELRSQR